MSLTYVALCPPAEALPPSHEQKGSASRCPCPGNSCVATSTSGGACGRSPKDNSNLRLKHLKIRKGSAKLVHKPPPPSCTSPGPMLPKTLLDPP